MRNLQFHENIIKFYEIFESSDSFYFIIELVEGITLQEYILIEKTIKESDLKKIIF